MSVNRTVALYSKPDVRFGCITAGVNTGLQSRNTEKDSTGIVVTNALI